MLAGNEDGQGGVEKYIYRTYIGTDVNTCLVRLGKEQSKRHVVFSRWLLVIKYCYNVMDNFWSEALVSVLKKLE